MVSASAPKDRVSLRQNTLTTKTTATIAANPPGPFTYLLSHVYLLEAMLEHEPLSQRRDNVALFCSSYVFGRPPFLFLASKGACRLLCRSVTSPECKQVALFPQGRRRRKRRCQERCVYGVKRMTRSKWEARRRRRRRRNPSGIWREGAD